jgi:predicted HNH restriction endonuclease
MDNQQKRLKERSTNKAQFRNIAKIYSCRCAVCGWHLPTITPKGNQYQGGCELHHIIAYKDGGTETVDNLILLCPNCHKLADCGILTADELRQHLRDKPVSGIEWLRQQYNLK